MSEHNSTLSDASAQAPSAADMQILSITADLRFANAGKVKAFAEVSFALRSGSIVIGGFSIVELVK